MAIVNVTDAEFSQEVLQSNTAVLVDFWAEWCGPCRMIGPILEELSEHYGEQLKIAKVNVDQNPETPAKYGVRGIPTLLLIKDGEVADTKVGASTKSQLIDFIDSAVNA